MLWILVQPFSVEAHYTFTWTTGKAPVLKDGATSVHNVCQQCFCLTSHALRCVNVDYWYRCLYIARSVCLCVGPNCEPYKNSWISRDAFRREDSHGPKELPVLDGGAYGCHLAYTMERSKMVVMRAVATFPVTTCSLLQLCTAASVVNDLSAAWIFMRPYAVTVSSLSIWCPYLYERNLCLVDNCLITFAVTASWLYMCSAVIGAYRNSTAMLLLLLFLLITHTGVANV